MLTADEVLRLCRACGRSGGFSVSEDAHDRAREKGHSPADLMHALAHATQCTHDAGRWTVRGPSLDGTEIALSVVLGAGALSVV